jgi:hypothetical protein
MKLVSLSVLLATLCVAILCNCVEGGLITESQATTHNHNSVMCLFTVTPINAEDPKLMEKFPMDICWGTCTFVPSTPPVPDPGVDCPLANGEYWFAAEKLIEWTGTIKVKIMATDCRYNCQGRKIRVANDDPAAEKMPHPKP